MINWHISYDPLFETIKKRNISQKELWSLAKISGSSRQRLRENKCVTTDIILRLCKVLDCDINEILKLVRD